MGKGSLLPEIRKAKMHFSFRILVHIKVIPTILKHRQFSILLDLLWPTLHYVMESGHQGWCITQVHGNTIPNYLMVRVPQPIKNSYTITQIHLKLILHKLLMWTA